MCHRAHFPTGLLMLACLIGVGACSKQEEAPAKPAAGVQAPAKPTQAALSAPPAPATPAAAPAAQPATPAPAAIAAAAAGGPAATEKHRLALTNYAAVPVVVFVNGNWVGQWDAHSGHLPLGVVLAGKNELVVEVQGDPKNQITLEIDADRGGWVNLVRLNYQGKPGKHVTAFFAK